MSDNSFAKTVTNGEKARKVTVNRSNWQREQQKRNRYIRKSLPKMPKCSHSGHVYHCKRIKGFDALSFSDSFYGCTNKVSQDAFILMHTKINVPKRRRGKGGPPKKFSVQYLMRKRNSKLVRICQTSFANILGITKVRIKGVIKRHFEQNTAPAENRGGDRISNKFVEKREAIINFVKRFQVLENHYCRSRVQRQYMSGELSINRLYRIFVNDFPDLVVKRSYFRYIFNHNFNIGFKPPSCDICSTCQSLKEQLKAETDPQKRNLLMTTLRVHKLRAKAFYGLAKEEKEYIETFSFDCQKNMLLPKVADQAAYYSRQLHLYNLGVVQGTSKAHLQKENVFLYLWTENERPKGSNEIASAVYHRLQHSTFSSKISKIRLICDGCGAQNKNTTMMVMCSYWLSLEAPRHITEIEIVFPIPGHSFIPPDRVFAQLEKKVKRKETIVKPEEYFELYKENGTIIRLGDLDCKIRDWKNAAVTTLKPPGQWHFKFNASKRFSINRLPNKTVTIRGDIAYLSDVGIAKSVVKKGKSLQNMIVSVLPLNVPVKVEKLKDVEQLLKKHFGENWRANEDLTFYKHVLEETYLWQVEEEICEAAEEEEIDLRV